MKTDTSNLSPDQQMIYGYLQKRHTVEYIAEKMGKPIGIIRANITRMAGKGCVPHHAHAEATARPEKPRAKTVTQADTRAVLEAAANAGPAQYDLEQAAEYFKSLQEGKPETAHPMVLMGVTIQFMRLCGGRFEAHQTIEDVYAAVRSFTGDSSPDTTIVTKPLPTKDEMTKIRTALEEIKERI